MNDKLSQLWPSHSSPYLLPIAPPGQEPPHTIAKTVQATMADDSSKTQEQREREAREAREAVNASIINDPTMTAAVQAAGRSSQRKREGSKRAMERAMEEKEKDKKE